MARWRQAVELAMTDEDIEALTVLSREDRTGEPGVAGRDAACLPRERVVLCGGTKT